MIDQALLEAYVAELEALRVQGQDIAKSHPDIAGRLDIGPRSSRDPHVERVVESTAFLTARLRMMIESSARETPMAMLTMLAPTLVEPVPSMAILHLDGGAEEQPVPRGTRFDFEAGGQVLASFSTTMPTIASRIGLRISRLDSTGKYRDGISIKTSGSPSRSVMFYIGSSDINAATLMDALDKDLSLIEIIPTNGKTVTLSPGRLQFHGFANSDAALPIRPATHPAHRVVTEFIAFPSKFRFVSISDPALSSGGEIRLHFNRPVAIDSPLPNDLFTVNRVPAINIWNSAATPIEITGRKLEYPVRADTLRYRTVECHSVEAVNMFTGKGSQQLSLDPILGLGDIQGTAIRWGIKRSTSRVGGEVMLFFQGLDYRTLGKQRLLIVPSIIANNRDVAERLPSGAILLPAKGLGNWQARLYGRPGPYIPAMTNSKSMETLIGYIRSGIEGFTRDGGANLLKSYMKAFPGSNNASWINGIKGIVLKSVAKLYDDHIVPGVEATIHFESSGYRTTSSATVRQVLRELLDSQRGLNKVMNVNVRSS